MTKEECDKHNHNCAIMMRFLHNFQMILTLHPYFLLLKDLDAIILVFSAVGDNLFEDFMFKNLHRMNVSNWAVLLDIVYYIVELLCNQE